MSNLVELFKLIVVMAIAAYIIVDISQKAKDQPPRPPVGEPPISRIYYLRSYQPVTVYRKIYNHDGETYVIDLTCVGVEPSKDVIGDTITNILDHHGVDDISSSRIIDALYQKSIDDWSIINVVVYQVPSDRIEDLK